MKRIFALFLALTMLLAGCAAADSGNNTTAATTENTTAVTQGTTVAAPEMETTVPNAPVGEDITFFSMNLNLTADDSRYMMVYPNPDGTVYVDFMGEVKKVGESMDAQILQSLADALEQTALWAMNNRNEYKEGDAVASVYVEYSDGTMLQASFSGVIPQDFLDGYETMETHLETATAHLEVYVPVPFVGPGVDEDILAELMLILENSGAEPLDMFQILDVALGDVFAYSMGLSSDEGIVNGTSCTPMMMTTPYSLVIATVADENDADDVQADFLANLDWTKWVCVMPTDAMVAQKGNMVLCLMAADDLYDQTAAAIMANGWENVEELEFPGA